MSQDLYADLRCECENREVSCRQIANKQWRYCTICTRCYRAEWIKHSLLSEEDKSKATRYTAVEYDRIRRCYQDKISAMYQERMEEKRCAESRQWWDEYGLYLNTSKWSKKRAAVLKRDDNLCQACLSRPAAHVHHLTYDNLFNEPLFDLVSVCRTCHKKIHGGRS